MQHKPGVGPGGVAQSPAQHWDRAAAQHELVMQDAGGCCLPPLTFESWEAHFSLLSRGSWNGSISCKGKKEALD